MFVAEKKWAQGFNIFLFLGGGERVRAWCEVPRWWKGLKQQKKG